MPDPCLRATNKPGTQVALQSIRAKSGVTWWQKVKAAWGREWPLPGGTIYPRTRGPWGCGFIGHWCTYHRMPLLGTARDDFSMTKSHSNPSKTPGVSFKILRFKSQDTVPVTTKPSPIFVDVKSYLLLLRPYLLSYNKVFTSPRLLLNTSAPFLWAKNRNKLW